VRPLRPGINRPPHPDDLIVAPVLREPLFIVSAPGSDRGRLPGIRVAAF
jgi:hypothetical protein